jgi:hypothetical protein
LEKRLKDLANIIENSSLNQLKFTEINKKSILNRINNNNNSRMSFFNKSLHSSMSLIVFAILLLIIFKIPGTEDEKFQFYNVQGNQSSATGLITGKEKVEDVFSSFIYPKYLPEGYEEVETSGIYIIPNDNSRYVFNSKYCNDQDCVYILQRNSAKPPVNEFNSDSTTTVQGVKAYLFNNKNRQEIVFWLNGDVYSIKGEIPILELKKIAQSMQKGH